MIVRFCRNQLVKIHALLDLATGFLKNQVEKFNSLTFTLMASLVLTTTSYF